MGWGNRELTGFGELLRQARAYKGVSLRDAERTTRIPRRHLSALENEEFHQLPPLIYARGIVRNYAQYLGLDPVETLSRFEQSHGQRSGGFRVVPAVKTVDVPSHWAPNFAIIAFMVVMSAVIFAWMYSAYFAPTDSSSPVEQASLTPTADQEEVAVVDEDEDEESESGISEGGGESLPSSGSTSEEDPDAQAETDDSEEAAEEPDEPDEPPAEESEEEEETEPDSEESGESEDVDESESDEPSQHTFTVSTTQRVWVQATVDGEVVFDDVIEPGAQISLEGEQMTLVSGNAPLVNVAVDGEERGALGDAWDATSTYP